MDALKAALGKKLEEQVWLEEGEEEEGEADQTHYSPYTPGKQSPGRRSGQSVRWQH